MLKKSFALVLAMAVSGGLSHTASATEDSASVATVVIYRADESFKTKRLRLDVRADSNKLGRLKANDVVVAEGEAGQYTLDTSMPDTTPLTLDLKPGATYYVHTKLKMRGSRVYVSLEQVTEQVARVQQPSLQETI